MFRRFASTAAVAALLIGIAIAADKEIKGKVVSYDSTTREITVKTASGDDEQKLAADAKVFDAKGAESKDGLKDKRIAKGAEVKLVIPDKARTVKELHFIDTTKADPKAKAKPEVKVKPEPKPDPKAKLDPKAKPEPKPEPKVKGDKAASSTVAKFGTDAKGTVAKVLKRDVEKRTVSVELENGKKAEYKVADDAKFIGPRGGTKNDIKDERLDVDHYVKIVVDAAGKTITEVHFAQRSSEKDDTPEKK